MSNIDEIIKQKLAEQERLTKELEELQTQKKKEEESAVHELNSKLNGLKEKKDAISKKIDGLEQAKLHVEYQLNEANEQLNSVDSEIKDIQSKLFELNVITTSDEKEEVAPPKIPVDETSIKEEKEEVEEKPVSPFEQAFETVKNVSEENTHYSYKHVFDFVHDRDFELYQMVDDIEKSGETNFKTTFAKLGTFLDTITDMILKRDNIEVFTVTRASDLMSRVNDKISYIKSKDLFALRADQVTYKCSSQDGTYLQTNCFLFLSMLYKTTTCKSTEEHVHLPVYNEEVMTKCIKCIEYVLKKYFNLLELF